MCRRLEWSTDKCVFRIISHSLLCGIISLLGQFYGTNVNSKWWYCDRTLNQVTERQTVALMVLQGNIRNVWSYMRIKKRFNTLEHWCIYILVWIRSGVSVRLRLCVYAWPFLGYQTQESCYQQHWSTTGGHLVMVNFHISTFVVVAGSIGLVFSQPTCRYVPNLSVKWPIYEENQIIKMILKIGKIHISSL